MTMTRIQLRTCSHKDSLFLNASREITITDPGNSQDAIGSIAFRSGDI